MPCYQPTSLPSGVTTSGRTGYRTEAECLQACKEGACCDGTTCTVKPQCQCQGTEKTFKGVGTTCSPNPCLCYCDDGVTLQPESLTATFYFPYPYVPLILYNTTTWSGTATLSRTSCWRWATSVPTPPAGVPEVNLASTTDLVVFLGDSGLSFEVVNKGILGSQVSILSGDLAIAHFGSNSASVLCSGDSQTQYFASGVSYISIQPNPLP